MFSKAEEYQNYKNEMLLLNKQITSAYKDDVYENADVTAIVETKNGQLKEDLQKNMNTWSLTTIFYPCLQ